MKTNQIYYELGKKDTIATLFCLIREKGVENTLNLFASFLKENPHVKFYLNNLNK